MDKISGYISENYDSFHFCTVARKICKDIFVNDIFPSEKLENRDTNRFKRQDSLPSSTPKPVSSTTKIVPTSPKPLKNSPNIGIRFGVLDTSEPIIFPNDHETNKEVDIINVTNDTEADLDTSENVVFDVDEVEYVEINDADNYEYFGKFSQSWIFKKQPTLILAV